MKKYRKKELIEVVLVTEKGNVMVQNEGKPNDRWLIPRDIFKDTYEEVSENDKA